jgi:heat shock protein HslJ
MRAVLLLGVLLLAGCRHEVQEAKRLLRGEPPVVTGALEGKWLLADLNGGGAPAVPVELEFDPGDQDTSRVAGSSGCNRFTGAWKQDGTKLTLGPLASTMMACPPPAMAVERKFLGVLQAVTLVDYQADGMVRLKAPDGRLLLLKRPPAS